MSDIQVAAIIMFFCGIVIGCTIGYMRGYKEGSYRPRNNKGRFIKHRR